MQIVGEIAQAHDGSLGIAHSYIDVLAETGVDAIKFQTHVAEAESSIHEKFRTKFSYEDKTRFDYWKRMEFSVEEWKGLKKHCDEKNIEFISSPFSNAAVDILEQIGVQRYKVGSGEVSNFLLLKKIAKTGKPIILSSGMSSFTELDKTIEFLGEFNNDLSILQCTTAYPTNPEQWGLNVIPELKSRYNMPVGFSDHSGDIYACLAAAALGAEILEFHVVFDKRMFGPDAKASLTIDETKKLVKGVNEINVSLNNTIDKNENKQFEELKNIFEKSLAVNKNLSEGSRLQFSDLEAKKPKGLGIDASNYKNVIGKKIKKDLKKWEFINYKDLHE
ncbi:N-acetylneuraminate synthase family protein [Rhodohalobacter sulfatireducens]|uniref:N-acetylneuraminate synthase family protein n=1 Tax=Rhodohalobacter sulfatireducens TaxID=2911366 RepID=A0ABS9KIZ3_9BACT|nr:N-acetylneuraminate synthase family protein [Rhodohalobacter sulfatireducens]MCG2590829.1 N-acetylneuraminate synthase family protein [Rhodohalobacter sulfatireducens]